MADNSSLYEDLSRIGKSHVLCVGDVMLDRFVYGSVERISPEAPIPVLLVEREKHMLGGAGNVVANIAALGARTTLIAVIGDDSAGQDIQKQLDELKIGAGLVKTNDRSTTVKSRFIGGQQQILRVDREKSAAISSASEDAVISHAEKIMPSVEAVILSDYKKGILTDKVISKIIAAAQKHKKPVIVDPKDKDFTRYKGASIITPNRKELETATGMKAASNDEVVTASKKIMGACSIPAVLATRSKDGMSLVTAKDAPLHIPAYVHEIYDVSGAGDTVVAAFAAAIGAGVSLQHAALLANIAAGIAVGKPGTATVRPEEIRHVLETDSPVAKTQMKGKVATRAEAAEQAERWKARGFKVGFTNGCFDLLHPGHLATLRQAKETCDFLIVAANSDASVKRLKGPTRPVQDEKARAAILAALAMVDLVVIFEEDTPVELLKAIKPDVLVKGGQYKLEQVVGHDIVMAYGGKVVCADMEDGFSTTNTIAKMAG